MGEGECFIGNAAEREREWIGKPEENDETGGRASDPAEEQSGNTLDRHWKQSVVRPFMFSDCMKPANAVQWSSTVQRSRKLNLLIPLREPSMICRATRRAYV